MGPSGEATAVQPAGPAPVLDNMGRVVIPLSAVVMGQPEPHESGRARPTRPCGRPRCLIPRALPQHPDAACSFAQRFLPQPAHWSVRVGQVAAAAGADGAACLVDLERNDEAGGDATTWPSSPLLDALPPSPFGPETGCSVRESHCSLHHGWEGTLFRRIVAAKGLVRDRIRLWVRLHGSVSSCGTPADDRSSVTDAKVERVPFVVLDGGVDDPGAFVEASGCDATANFAANLGLLVSGTPSEELPSGRSSVAEEHGRTLMRLQTLSGMRSTTPSALTAMPRDEATTTAPLGQRTLGLGAASPAGSLPASRSSSELLALPNDGTHSGTPVAAERPRLPQPDSAFSDPRGALKRQRELGDEPHEEQPAKRLLREGD